MIFVHIPQDRRIVWKTPLDGAKEHRLEAYAILRRRVVTGCTEMAPGMALRDRSTVRKTM
jgi:hypothetical protein